MSSQTSIRRDVNIRLNAFRTDAPAGAPDLKAADLANHLEDFRLSTDVHEAPAQYRPHDARSAPAGDLTQSERDWAFAKRALARGDDPEEILRRIADYRGEQKHPNRATRGTPLRKLKPHYNPSSARWVARWRDRASD